VGTSHKAQAYQGSVRKIDHASLPPVPIEELTVQCF
jgi:hypothetical protein